MEMVTKVELSISCKDLKKTDLTSKSDPVCAVEYFEYSKELWVEYDRTELIKNSLNPNFSKKFTFDYHFESVQKLRFIICDQDSFAANELLGQAECTLGNIVSSKRYQRPLMTEKGKLAASGTIHITAEEITDNRLLHLTLKAFKLDNKDFFGKSDPFLEFWRESDDGGWTLIHRTEVVKNNLNPVWRPLQIPLQTFCSGNLEKTIKVVCSDWDSDGSHDLIGEFYTTTLELETSAKPKDFPCIHPKKKAKKSYKNSGIISVTEFKMERQYSFLDYVMGGLNINFTVGIDFTLSNRESTLPTSLHYMGSSTPNPYAKALLSVGNVVQDYDSDRLFSAFGFGGKLSADGEVRHEFALNFNEENPYCVGIEGILEAYYRAVTKVELWAPTKISPIINNIARFAQKAEEVQTRPDNYFILLLITDGVIDDMDETCNAIVHASHLPMSIIIVGVGDANFSAMEKLDGDHIAVTTKDGKKAARDIVQFVPFRSVVRMGQEELAKYVLEEVPKQVTSYFKQKEMAPGLIHSEIQ